MIYTRSLKTEEKTLTFDPAFCSIQILPQLSKLNIWQLLLIQRNTCVNKSSLPGNYFHMF
jgi:hypothetical protein